MIYDPYADAQEVRHEYGLEILSALPDDGSVDAVILAVFCRKGEEPILIDVKGFFEPEAAQKARLRYWRLW